MRMASLGAHEHRNNPTQKQYTRNLGSGSGIELVYTNATYGLTVTKAGTGSGTVTSSPPGINCGTGCAASFAFNSTVTLTAAPAAGSTFSGWSGACTGTGTCNVQMTAAPSVTATFTLSTISHPPVIAEGESISVHTFPLTLHATDSHGDTITWSIQQQAGHGTATVSGTGTTKAIHYTPVPNYAGSDSFVVHVSDGQGGTDTITVNVTVEATAPIWLPLIFR